MAPKGKAKAKSKAKAKAEPAAKKQKTCAASAEEETAIVPWQGHGAMCSVLFHKRATKMRNLLVYRSSDQCKKATPAEKQEASQALAKYDLLTNHEERQHFLRQFDSNGGGVGPNALKFVSTFQKSLEFNDSTTLKQVEDYFTPGEILIFNGTSLSAFKSVTEAIKDAEYLVKKNMEANGWTEDEHPPLLDEVKPEYSRYWYVRGMGKETSWEQKQNKKLEGNANLKNVGQLQKALGFMECMGYQEEEGASSSVQIENVKYTLLMKELEHCKST